MILAAFIVGGCLVAMPYGWAMLRGRRRRYDRVGLLLPLTVAMIAAPRADRRRRLGGAARRRAPTRRSSRRWRACTTRPKGAPLHLGGIYVDDKVEGRDPHPRRALDPRVPPSARGGEGTRRGRAAPTGRRSTSCASRSSSWSRSARDARARVVDAARVAQAPERVPARVGSCARRCSRVPRRCSRSSADGSPPRSAASPGSYGRSCARATRSPTRRTSASATSCSLTVYGFMAAFTLIVLRRLSRAPAARRAGRGDGGAES